MSRIHCTAAGVAILIAWISVCAPLLPAVSISHAVLSTSSRAASILTLDSAIQSCTTPCSASGLPNAVKLFAELKEAGRLKPGVRYGIRLDSGDLAYLSKVARKILDEAGFAAASITASNDLDESLIAELKLQGAKIDSWGVGTKLITSEGCSSFGGVYKLAAEIRDGEIIPKLKRSDNAEKINNPGLKKLLRIYDKSTGKIKADIVALAEEEFSPERDLNLTDKNYPWQRTTLKKGTYTVRELLVPVFLNGQCVYERPSLPEIKKYAEKEAATLWEEYRRLVNPHVMKVNLSDKLYNLRKDLLFLAEPKARE